VSGTTTGQSAASRGRGRLALAPEGELRLALGAGVALTATHIALLQGVTRTGSLRRASEGCDLPYPTARYHIRRLERAYGVRLLATRSGGMRGGSTNLTAEALELLERWAVFSAGFDDWLRARFLLAFAQPLQSVDEAPSS